MKLNVGCGPSKKAGYFGMDIHPYEGVDLVQDIGNVPWKIDESSCEEVFANQVIEHVADLKSFFNEVYRVGKDGCIVKLTTPHYSSHNSWADPTHIHHLSFNFCKPFTEGYLKEQIVGFEVVSNKITFGSFLWSWPGRLICAVFGDLFYEKRFAWMFPASSIIVHLVIKK